MNSFFKALLAAGILALFNLGAWAEDAASAVPSLQVKENLIQEEQEAASDAPTLLDEAKRLKELNPKQLAEEQKALYETMQKLTPQQLDGQRKGMLNELSRMSPEEYKSLNDKAQTEEEKVLAREYIEHSADPQHEAAASKPIPPAAKQKTASTKARPANKRKARNHSPPPLR